jgi:hypothetical protein
LGIIWPKHLTTTPKEGKEEKLFPDTLFLCTTYVVGEWAAFYCVAPGFSLCSIVNLHLQICNGNLVNKKTNNNNNNPLNYYLKKPSSNLWTKSILHFNSKVVVVTNKCMLKGKKNFSTTGEDFFCIGDPRVAFKHLLHLF